MSKISRKPSLADTLFKTIKYGDIIGLDNLLKDNPNILKKKYRSKTGLTPLMYAFVFYNPTIINLLHGYDVNIHEVDTKGDNILNIVPHDYLYEYLIKGCSTVFENNNGFILMEQFIYDEKVDHITELYKFDKKYNHFTPIKPDFNKLTKHLLRNYPETQKISDFQFRKGQYEWLYNETIETYEKKKIKRYNLLKRL